MSEEKKSDSKKPLLIIGLAAAICVAGGAAGFYIASSSGGEEPVEEDSEPKLSYASEGVTFVEDPEAFQKAVDELYEKAQDGYIALEFKNVAISDDGTNFDCYLANSLNNKYDTYFQIFADETMTDEIFLSDLLKPGQAFDTIALSHPLEKGTTTVYVAQTLVEEDLETLAGQTVYTMDFTVQ